MESSQRMTDNINDSRQYQITKKTVAGSCILDPATVFRKERFVGKMHHKSL